MDARPKQLPYVFLGPTMAVRDAREILEAHYLPPVALGDVYRLVTSGATTIAIIDGLFEQTPAVWHKEILFALSRGIRVFGASSMGALRAAELADFGMVGVGEVFHAFKSGLLEDDDEVAITHAAASDDYRPLSEAMVTIRVGLGQALNERLLNLAAHDDLIAHAKRLYYPERSWHEICRRLGATCGPADAERLREFISRLRPDAKRVDAIRLLQRIRDEAQENEPLPKPSAWDFESTWCWEQMILREGALQDLFGSGVKADYLSRHVRVNLPHTLPILERALLISLAREHAKEIGVDPPGLQSQEIGNKNVEVVAEVFRSQIDRALPAVIAGSSEYAEVIEMVQRKARVREDLGSNHPTPSDIDMSGDHLFTWYKSNFKDAAETSAEQAKLAGFANEAAFLSELTLEYVVRCQK